MIALVLDDGNVVVGIVHARAHQVRHAGIDADIVFVDALPVDHPRHEEARRPCDVSAALHDDLHGCQPLGLDDLLIDCVDASANRGDVNDILPREVGNADATAEVHHLHLDAELLMDLHRQQEEHARGLHQLVDLEAVRHHHGVEAEALDAKVLALLVALEQLSRGAAELGRLGVANELVARPAGSGIEAEADHLGQAILLVQEVNMGEVIQVHEGSELLRLLELFDRCVVASEHDFLGFETHLLGQHELGDGRAVGATSLLLQHLQDVGIRCRLHGEVVPETWAPSHRGVETPNRLTDGSLIVNVEGRRKLLGKLHHLGVGKWEVRKLRHAGRRSSSQETGRAVKNDRL
mmetsp:Transcript_89033/g.251284  ORF Transcript_89033/g.251284 Transcript_89033/m.251284 type:complete len:350 (+) Transcript_89033:439-1488(+)